MTDPRIRWPRRPRPVLVALVAFAIAFPTGVLANLAAGFLLLDGPADDSALQRINGRFDWLGVTDWPAEPPAELPTRSETQLWGSWYRADRRSGPDPHRGRGWIVMRTQAGWPLPVVRDLSVLQYSVNTPTGGHSILYGNASAAPAAFAALLAGLVAAPGVWRGVRLRRGLCPVCKYPRGTSDTCAECGFVHDTIPRRAATRE